MSITAYELRETRVLYGESQAAFARRLGVSTRTITTWERDGVPDQRELSVLREIGPSLSSVRATIAGEAYFNSDEYLDDLARDHEHDPNDPSTFQGTILLERSDRQLTEVAIKLEGVPTEDILFELIRRNRDTDDVELARWKAMFRMGESGI